MQRFIASSFATVMSLLVTVAVCAQDYPVKMIRIVTSPPGGSNDFVTRLLVKGLTERAGWQFGHRQPSHRSRARGGDAGGSGWLHASRHRRHVRHGLSVRQAFLRAGPGLHADLAHAHRQPNILAVHPSLPVKSVKELIALAKSRPGQLNYGSSGVGSTNHVSAEVVQVDGRRAHRAHQLQRSRSCGERTAQRRGATHVRQPRRDLAFLCRPAACGPLAITSAEPSPLYPGLPTMVASGLAGFEDGGNDGRLCAARHACGDREPTESGNRTSHQPARDQGEVFDRRRRDDRQLAAGIDERHEGGDCTNRKAQFRKLACAASDGAIH